MQYAKIDTAASGDTAIVPAVAGRRIRLLGYVLAAGGSVTATWKSGTTARTGPITLASGAPLVVPAGGDRIDPVPCLETEPGEALTLTLSGAVQVSGHVVYDLA